MGPRKFVTLLGAAGAVLAVANLVPSVTHAQSVADAAKQQRARLCKEGKTQYCDDGQGKDKPRLVVDEQGLSGPGAEQSASAPESSQGRPSVGDLQNRLDELSEKTPRQLGDQVAGDVQFPGRDRWETRLSAARDKLVTKIQVVLDVLRLDKPNATALNNAVFYMKTAGSDYRDLQTEGHSAAADWKRKTENSTSSKSEPKQPR